MMEWSFGVAETVASVSGGSIVLAVALRRWISSMSFDQSSNSAGIHMIEQMRVEIIRLASTNQELMAQVQELREQNFKLHDDVRALNATIVELQQYQMHRCSKCHLHGESPNH